MPRWRTCSKATAARERRLGEDLARPPQRKWPGDALPDFITSSDSKQTRGYPALTSAANGVGRQVFLGKIDAEFSHRAGLVQLFRIQQADQVKYIEKRPPLTPTVQLTMSAIDNGFLADFFDAAIIDALTKDGAVEIRDAATFAARAADALDLCAGSVMACRARLIGVLPTRARPAVLGPRD